MLSYERRCAESVKQTSLLVAALDGFDLGKQVPSTPDWTVNQLLRHLGHAHRWADEMIREKLPEIDLTRNRAQDVAAYAGETTAELGPWLMEGASSLSAALQAVDPNEMIASIGGHPGPRMWSRRMANETVIHRWDVVNALGMPFEVAPEGRPGRAARVDRFRAAVLVPAVARRDRSAAGPGRTVHLPATDVCAGGARKGGGGVARPRGRAGAGGLPAAAGRPTRGVRRRGAARRVPGPSALLTLAQKTRRLNRHTTRASSAAASPVKMAVSTSWNVQNLPAGWYSTHC